MTSLMSHCPAFALLATCVLVSAAPCAAEEPARPPAPIWRVVTKESPPFAFRSGADGPWQGIGIELAEQIADRLDVELRISTAITVDEMLSAVSNGRADAAIAAISVTPAREQRVDFSHPYFSTGLGVVVRRSGDDSLAQVWEAVLSRGFLHLLLVACLCLLPVGILFWLLERRHHPDYKEATTRRGLGTGVWWSTSILLGNRGVAPRSLAGKVLAASGMLLSILFISLLTGALASILTLSKLETRIRDLGDLSRLDTLSVSGTSGAEFLHHRGIPSRTVTNVEAGLAEVEAGRADALVHDEPILRYLVLERHLRELRVVDRSFDTQDYAVALALESPWRKPVNRALLEARSSDEWNAIRIRYLGRR